MTDEQLLDGQAQPFLERIAILLHHGNKLEKTIDFLGRRRSAISAACEIGQNLASRCGVGRVGNGHAAEDFGARVRRWAAILVIRPDHVQIHGEKGVGRAGFAESRIGRLRTFVSGGQTLIHPQYAD